MAQQPYGVLGRTLGHSYTPWIYRELAGLDYRRFEVEPEDVATFLAGDAWEGVNVTIPYKVVAAGLVDELTDTARRLGNVNTITRAADGHLVGDNTDYFGFEMLVTSLGVDLAGKRALVFGGHGGAGSTAMTVLADLGANPVSVCRTRDEGASRASAWPSITYDELATASDASLAVNCTPVGMYPACPDQVCSLEALPALEAVVDIVYNPARTGLMMEAERRGVACAGGLLMLVAQAAAAVRRYTGAEIGLDRIREVTQLLDAHEENIALIGMPGCGKTRVGEALARMLGREHVDIDRELEAECGTSCHAFITEQGEDTFRAAETACLARIAGRSGLVISCGGGVVTRDANYALLHQNSRIIMLDRPLAELSAKGRPITQRDGVEKLAQERMGHYRAWADEIVTSRENADATARWIIDQHPLWRHKEVSQ